MIRLAALSLVMACHPMTAAQVPVARPEIQKLGYYVGHWEGKGETRGGPFGPVEYDTGGTIVGNERSFTKDLEEGGKRIKVQYVEVQRSPAAFTYRAEVSIDGGPRR